ncbi:Mce/MlaD family protein, partial [Mycolicibacterium sphagni]|nr:mammalian cell entry protein [Mycolicibacterium sphagni]
LTSLSEAITALNDGRGDFFAVAKSLALFVNALHQSDQQFVALNSNLAEFTDSFNRTDSELADTLGQVDQLLSTARDFVDQNGEVLAHNVNNLSEATTALLQPEPRDGLETALHVFPNLAANLVTTYEPTSGALSAIPVVASFANPMQFICSSIQAGSRLGYQE